MFYSPELLMMRRKGKFAKCWLAANLSKSIFCQKFRRDAVVGINVEKTCQDLISIIVGRDSNVKCSLYLSANLMLGATRILLYQTDMCIQLQFEFQRRIIFRDRNDVIDAKPKRKKMLQVEDLFVLPEVEVPIREIDFFGNLANEADITLIDIGGVDRLYETTMQAANQLDFGALTSKQMDEMLKQGGLCLDSPDSIRVLHAPSEVSLPEIEAAVAPHVFKIPDPRRGKEKSRNGTETREKTSEGNKSLDNIPLTEPPPELANEGLLTTKVVEPPRTPTKHKLSPQIDVETPTKKRREFQAECNSELVRVSIPAEPLTAVQVVNAVPSDSDGMVLDSLDESFYEWLNRPTKRNKKKKIVADKITQLQHKGSINDAMNLLSGTRVPTAAEDIIHLPLPTAEQLLRNPSVRKPWAKSLLLNYEMMILEPISELRIKSKLRDARKSLSKTTKGSLFREILREPVDVSAGERSDEISNKLFEKGLSSTDTSTKDRTHTLDPISIEGTLMSKTGLRTLVENTDLPEQAPPDLPEVFPLPDDLLQSDNFPRTSSVESFTNLPKNVRKIIRDWSENGQTFRLGNRLARESSEKSHTIDFTPPKTLEKDRMEHQASSSSLTFSSGMSQEMLDLIGWLESLWTERPVIKFKELCPVDKNTKKSAGQMFVNLLELNRAKIIRLSQARPFRAIYIQKYSPYF